MRFRRTHLAVTLLTLLSGLAILTAAPAGAQTYRLDYDASLGTLPSAQGWVHFVDDPLPDDALDESNYSVAAGVLTQGSTGGVNVDDANQQWYEVPSPQFDFDDDVIEIELRLRILTSTMTPPPALGPRAGFGVLLYDKDKEEIGLFIGATGLFLFGDNSSTSDLVVVDTTSSLEDYRLRVDRYGASIWLNGAEVEFLPRADFGIGAGSNEVRIGDLTTIERSSSELASFRFARFNPAVAEVRNLAMVTQLDPLGNPSSDITVVVCPAGTNTIAGGGRIFGDEDGVALSASYRFDSISWRANADRVSGPGEDWQLQADVICGEVPGYEVSQDSITDEENSNSLAVLCPESKTVIGGGAQASDNHSGAVNRLFGSAPSTGAGSGWEAEAYANIPAGFESTLGVSAFCSDARDWTVVTATTVSDDSSPKSIGAVCPVDLVAVGGGTRMLGTPGNPRLTASHPETLVTSEPVLWTGIAHAFVDPGPGDEWSLEVTAFCAPNAEPTVTRNGLIGRWVADSGFAVDENGISDGTLVNGATIEPGLMDKAFSVERANEEWVSIPGDEFYPAGSFTVDAFFQTDSLEPGELATIASLYDFGGLEGGNSSFWTLQLTPDGFAYGAARPKTSSGTPDVTGSDFLADGEPHHMALVRDLGLSAFRVELYVDGALVDTFGLTNNNNAGPFAPAGSPDPVTVGVFRVTLSTELIREFDGLIDDLKFYDRALTPEEIENIAGCGVPILPRTLNLDASKFGGPATIPNDHKLCVFLEAGSYDLELVSSVEEPAARFTGWAPSGESSVLWGTAYSVVGDTLATGGGIPIGENSAQEAFDNTVAKTISFSVASDQQVYFAFEDNPVLDNQGGVSLRLTFLPEPSVASMWLAGTVFLALLERRRRRA